jgi:hypothetical protein
VVILLLQSPERCEYRWASPPLAEKQNFFELICWHKLTALNQQGLRPFIVCIYPTQWTRLYLVAELRYKNICRLKEEIFLVYICDPSYLRSQGRKTANSRIT